jgi:hypothetical protein
MYPFAFIELFPYKIFSEETLMSEMMHFLGSNAMMISKRNNSSILRKQWEKPPPRVECPGVH